MKILITIIFTLFFVVSGLAQTQAEVVAETTHLRKSPDYGAPILVTLAKGDKITFEKTREAGGWYYVSIAGGQTKGWIRSTAVRALKDEAKPAVAAKVSAPKAPPAEPPPPVSVQPPNANANAAAAANAAPDSPSAPVLSDEVVEDDEVVQVDTEEVSLNVRVVDANNRPVGSLDQAQFQVYEDDVPQPITSFTMTEVPVINALVIDNSRSLRAQLGKVIEAGKIIVGANRARDETAVVRFVSTDKIEVVQDFTTSKRSLSEAMDNLFVEGGQTAIIDAVYQTAGKVENYLPSARKEDVKLRSLIVVSDGDDRVSKRTEQELFELLRNSNVQIYAIGFLNENAKDYVGDAAARREKARSFLTRLAQETGGKVYFPASLEELPQIASEISGELRTQYLISYAPTNDNRDGGFRKIKVLVGEGANREKRIAVTRSGRNSLPK